MAPRISRNPLPLPHLLHPHTIKPILHPSRLRRQLGILRRPLRRSDSTVRQRRMPVRIIQKRIEAFFFVQPDEHLGLLDAGGRVGRPLPERPLQGHDVLGGFVRVLDCAALAVGAEFG